MARKRRTAREMVPENLPVQRKLAAIVGPHHSHSQSNNRSAPSATAIPPTSAPTPTQTGAPGPHASPAAAPPRMPAPILALCLTASRPGRSDVATL